MAAEDLEWERSKISNQDVNLLKRLGLMKKEDAIRFPSEESYPNPPMEYRVSFVDHLIRGLSTPIHDFLRGLLFVYGIQLHQLTPNSILHISIFITLCECFLGITPNWILWKRIFCLRRNGSHNATYNIGGVVICVRTDVDYFDVKFPDSVQGWRKRIRVQPLQARKNPLWTYAGVNDANRLSNDLSVKDLEKLIRRISSLSKRDPIPSSCRVEPYSSTNPLPKNHPTMDSLPPLPEGGDVEERAVVADDNQEAPSFVNEPADSRKSAGSIEKDAASEAQTNQDFDLENPDNDPLLDALSYLELHGREIREGVANASAGLSALFPYFFPKKEEPSTFLALAKNFNSSRPWTEDASENMKVAVETLLPVATANKRLIG
ncbi:hypothetical protein QYE76_005072 [Lolium multiflorum]|uniref:Transposase (putative) gypsy type domain-containing protein n=1 Tax=Lolium multiflorum TaxID=4521 RepID=A0AAD8RTQ2_LOLMU|nr:hypothetical protein QYE76_005072 [Lolium multiflorum]